MQRGLPSGLPPPSLLLRLSQLVSRYRFDVDSSLFFPLSLCPLPLPSSSPSASRATRRSRERDRAREGEGDFIDGSIYRSNALLALLLSPPLPLSRHNFSPLYERFSRPSCLSFVAIEIIASEGPTATGFFQYFVSLFV